MPSGQVHLKFFVHALLIPPLATFWLWWSGSWFSVGSIPPMSPLFADLHGPLSWLECLYQGVEAASIGACDPYGRAFNYGPGILWLAPLGLAPQHANLLAISLLASFFGLSAWVIRPATYSELLIYLLMALSPAFVLAYERANLDLLMAVTIGAAAVVAGYAGRRGPIAAWLLWVFATSIKLYPAAALPALLHRRWQSAAGKWIGFAALVYLGAFVSSNWQLLQEILGNMPQPELLRDRYVVGGPGIMEFFIPGGDLRQMISLSAGSAAILAFWILPAMRTPNASDTQKRLFLVGATCWIGTFLPAMNFSYRAVLLIWTLPHLFAVGADCRMSPARRISAKLIPIALILGANGPPWITRWLSALADQGGVGAGEAFLARNGMLLSQVIAWAATLWLLRATVSLLREDLELVSSRLANPGWR